MLKLTKKADYGLIAMRHLAQNADHGSVSAKDLADAYGIPQEALAKILQRLAKARLLISQHGINGGYALAREARSISAFEVIKAIEGPLFITSCTKGAKGCDLTPSCTIKEPLARVNDTISGVLKSISIFDLADHESPSAKVGCSSKRPESRPRMSGTRAITPTPAACALANTSAALWLRMLYSICMTDGTPEATT